MNRLGVILAATVALATAASAHAAMGTGTIEEEPDHAHEVWKEKAEEAYKEGMKARAAGDATNAVRFLLRCANMNRMRIDSPYPLQAFNELKVITEEARKELVVARQLISGEAPDAGMMELQRITRTYFGLWPAKEAGKLMRQLEGDPKFQATLKAGRLDEDLRRAVALEAEAEAMLKPPAEAPKPGPAPSASPPAPPPPGVSTAAVREKELTADERRAARLGKLLEAYEIYDRILKQGPDTEPGRKAAAARRRLEQDEALMARIRDAQAENQAREWLSLAYNYFRAGRFDSAKEYCGKILSECPRTPQAAEARDLLGRMK